MKVFNLFCVSGEKNLDSNSACVDCELSRDIAKYKVVKRKRLSCKSCGHRHRYNQYCHAYTYVDFPDEKIKLEVYSDEMGQPLKTPVWNLFTLP